MPSGYGSQRRPGPGYSPYGGYGGSGGYGGYRGPRRYGWGYGGPSGPSAWDEPSDEPWTGGDDGLSGDGLSGDGLQASGRWVRRGRQIILIGV